MSLYKLVEAIVECAIVPLAGGIRRGAGREIVTGPPQPDPEETKLKEALEKSDRTLVVFGANLGNAQIGNRNTLSANFTAGLRDDAIGKAGNDGAAASESVRHSRENGAAPKTLYRDLKKKWGAGLGPAERHAGNYADNVGRFR